MGIPRPYQKLYHDIEDTDLSSIDWMRSKVKEHLGGMQDADIERQGMGDHMIDAARYSLASIRGHGVKGCEEIKVDMSLMPKVNPGPHMYDAECHCESCSEWTAKQNAGLNICLDTVRREAELTQQIALDAWCDSYEARNTPHSDPVMSIPASVVIALCDKADMGHWEGKFEIVAKENSKLQAEIDRLKDKPKPHCHDGPHQSSCRDSPSGKCVRTDMAECTGCEFF